MILYTRSGNIVSTEPTDQLSGLPIEFVSVSDKVITSLETGDGDFLLGRSNIDTMYWNGYLTVIHPLDNYYLIIRTIVLIALFIGFLSILFTSTVRYLLSS